MGGKYPHLCMLIDLLLELEPERRFIHIDRPIEESIQSLVDRSAKAHGWLRATPEQFEQLQRSLWEAKTTGLATAPLDHVLTLQYNDLLADPAGEVGHIASFLGLNVRFAQRDSAVDLVRPAVVAQTRPVGRKPNEPLGEWSLVLQRQHRLAAPYRSC
jgi:sulfotransferase family protein